jgi:hypothetical protein
MPPFGPPGRFAAQGSGLRTKLSPTLLRGGLAALRCQTFADDGLGLEAAAELVLLQAVLSELSGGRAALDAETAAGLDQLSLTEARLRSLVAEIAPPSGGDNAG